MPYNPYNPYNPYAPQPAYFQQPQAQPQPQNNTYAFVNGIEGAKSYPMAPNQTVMLMDSENPIAYMKQSNSMGQATIKYFKLAETNESELRGQSVPQSASEYVTKADFSVLEKKVEELLKPAKKSKTED